MEFESVMEIASRSFEAVGVAVLVIGGVWAFIRALGNWRRGANVYVGIRRDFGRALLLGLEILVAADIIKTVSVATTLENVVILGVLVLVRTLLSFSLDVEIEGVAPWRRRQFEGASDVDSAPVKDPLG
jgi:uncharacterized membrane protein